MKSFGKSLAIGAIAIGALSATGAAACVTTLTVHNKTDDKLKWQQVTTIGSKGYSNSGLIVAGQINAKATRHFRLNVNRRKKKSFRFKVWFHKVGEGGPAKYLVESNMGKCSDGHSVTVSAADVRQQ